MKEPVACRLTGSLLFSNLHYVAMVAGQDEQLSHLHSWIRTFKSRPLLLTKYKGVLTMATFVISYDLNNDKDYSKLWLELERLNCVRALESVWIGNLTGSVESVKNHFTKYVDSDDSLIIAETHNAKLAFKRPYQKALDWQKKSA